MTLSPAQLEQRRTAGRARAKQFTSESQKAARAKVRPESLKRAGELGQAVTREKYGDGWAAEQFARWRRQFPNRPTRRVRGWLYQWGYNRFDLDAPMGTYFADIWLYDSNVVIEIEGEHWHTNNDHIGYDREARDAERLRFIVLARRCIVIKLSEKAILSGAAKDWLRARLDVLTTLRKR